MNNDFWDGFRTAINKIAEIHEEKVKKIEDGEIRVNCRDLWFQVLNEIKIDSIKNDSAKESL